MASHLNVRLLPLVVAGVLAVHWGNLPLVSAQDVAGSAALPYKDPAPPKVSSASLPTPPTPRENPEVTFHQKPKPLAAGAVTEDWPRFIGPRHNGTSEEKPLLKEWGTEGPKLVWEMKRGTGYASPAIVGDRLAYFHRIAGEEVVECLHPETGEIYWQHRYPTTFKDRYGYNNGPRASPVIDDGKIYTLGAQAVLCCLDLATGQAIWQRNLTEEFGLNQEFFGMVGNPLVEGGLLILNLGAPAGPTVAAFDKRTGAMVWGTGQVWGSSCSSPVPIEWNGRRLVLVFAGGESRPPNGGLMVIDPVDGGVVCEFPWRSKSVESVNAACPVFVDGKVLVTASYKTGSALLDLAGGCSVVWKSMFLGAHFNTPVHVEGHFYAFDGRNEPDASLVCIDASNGELVWKESPRWEERVTWEGEERTFQSGTLRGCLLHADGAFLCLGELGSLQWLDLSPKGYREISRKKLFEAPETWSLPVLSRGLLYICQHHTDMLDDTPPRLLCYDLRGE